MYRRALELFQKNTGQIIPDSVLLEQFYTEKFIYSGDLWSRCLSSIEEVWTETNIKLLITF